MTVILSHTAVLLDPIAYFTGIAMCVCGGGGEGTGEPTLPYLNYVLTTNPFTSHGVVCVLM